MILVVASLLVLLSPLLVGRMPALVERPWRLAWLAVVALALQVVVIETPVGPAAPFLHVLTYVLAGGVLWANRRTAGLWVVSLGAACNGVAIVLNGGVLPASPDAERAAGFDPDVEFLNSGAVEDPVLPWLGDVFAWPAPLPLANTFSIGDVLLVVGVGVLAWRGSHRLGTAPYRQNDQGAAPAALAGGGGPVAQSGATSVGRPESRSVLARSGSVRGCQPTPRQLDPRAPAPRGTDQPRATAGTPPVLLRRPGGPPRRNRH